MTFSSQHCRTVRRAGLACATAVLATLLLSGAASATPPARSTSNGVPAAPPQAGDPTSCLDGIAQAQRRYQTPSGLLTAIALVESGRRAWNGGVEPWPWTVTANGQSMYFDTKVQAVAWIRQAQDRGLSSIDVGCMQINLHYHPTAFTTLADAFDPAQNADYAARFLRRLCADAGNWRQAVANYHSQTPDLGTPYRQKVESRLARAPDAPQQPSPSPSPSPLLRLQAAWAATLSAAPQQTDAVTIGFQAAPPQRARARPEVIPAACGSTVAATRLDGTTAGG